MKISKEQLTQIIKESLDEGGFQGDDPSWAGDPLDRPVGAREFIGEEVADALEGALKEYLREKDLDPGVANNIMLDVEEQLLDVAIAVSETIGDHRGHNPRTELQEKKK